MSEAIWRSVLGAIPDISTWNANLEELKRLAAEYGPECKAFIAAEAERRGYIWHSPSKKYLAPFPMRACKGVNVIGCGAMDGKLRIAFAAKDGARHYESEEKLPDAAEIAGKLQRSPYPDRLYNTLVKNKSTKMVRIP